MNNYMQDAMAEATRLTRAGRLAEATAMIQRTLAGSSTTNVVEADPSPADAPIEAESRVIDGASPSTETPREDVIRVRRTARDAATAHSTVVRRPLFPNVLRVPNSMPRTIEAMPLVVPDVVSSSVHTSGQFVEQSYTNTAGTRSYKLYIPSGYTGQAVPLVVMLHGCTQTAVNFAAGTRMNMLAEGETFLVAYPEQEPSANSSKCWNWFQESDQHRNIGEPALIAGITQQIMSRYHVDARRVYIAGLSSGGAMAAIMAATYPDLYAAVGVHSGLAYGAAHDLPSAFLVMKQGKLQRTWQLTEVVPLIVFHGDRDTTVASANADRLLDQWSQGTSDRPGSVHRSVRDVKVERGQVTNGHAYTRSIYHDTSGQVIIEKWMIHQAGHAWSGGSPGGSYTDPKGPDASAEMMRFFTEHSKMK
ncbi:MAG: PHB depolymerase family esterase [Ktedonobacteraceae bacterium]